jgi:murein DD-endopeptidase MepM/ murein hydrolase activator NlpD
VSDRVTVIVVPDETSPVRRFQVPRALLRHGIWIAALVAMLVTAGLVDYIRLRVEAVEVEQLRVETRRHRENLLELTEDVSVLERELARVQEFERKVRVIADLPAAMTEASAPAAELGAEAGPQGLPTGPAGGEAGPWELAPGARDVLDPESADLFEAVARTQRTAQGLILSSRNRRDSFDALLEELDGKRHRLASTPSIWPTDGWVTSGFGYRTSPFTGQRKFHAGVDIAADAGTPILAPARGKVIFTGRKGPLGKTLILDHGYGIRTTYGHTSAVHVKSGQEVDRGERIADVGSTGRSTGPHLHYGISVNEKSVNPSDYIIR